MSKKYLQSELFFMIGKNEEIIWQGKPDIICFILESIFNPLLIFAIIWGIFDFSIISLFISSLSKETFPDTFSMFFVVFFLFHLMPVWIYLSGVIFSFLKYKNTIYVITDKGIYCSGGIFSKTFEHKPFAELSHINLHRGIIDQLLGVGDIVATSNHDGYNSRERHSLYRGITICDIREYKRVYKLVKDLQTDIYTDTMYPNDLRPKENHGFKTRYTKRNDI